jgi:hypothetical protein
VLSNAYQQVVWVYRAINVLAEQVAQLAVDRLPKGIVGLDLAGNEANFPALPFVGLFREAQQAGLPGSKLIPSAQALRACLALKLWSIERKSHVMALVADEGLALFAGLNVFPKKSFFSEYSCCPL